MREVAYRKRAWSRLVLWTIGNRTYRREVDDLFRRIESDPHVQVSMVGLFGYFLFRWMRAGSQVHNFTGTNAREIGLGRTGRANARLLESRDLEGAHGNFEGDCTVSKCSSYRTRPV
jgi:hypothetical protein